MGRNQKLNQIEVIGCLYRTTPRLTHFAFFIFRISILILELLFLDTSPSSLGHLVFPMCYISLHSFPIYFFSLISLHPLFLSLSETQNSKNSHYSYCFFFTHSIQPFIMLNNFILVFKIFLIIKYI